MIRAQGKIVVKRKLTGKFIGDPQEDVYTFNLMELGDCTKNAIGALHILMTAYIEYLLPREGQDEIFREMMEETFKELPNKMGSGESVSLDEYREKAEAINKAIIEYVSFMDKWVGVKTHLTILSEEG